MWSPLQSQGGDRGVGRFDHTVAALSKEIIQLCFHAVAHPDDDEPYSVLKEDLLQQHTLTKYQRIERLLAVSPLGSRRPTQLVAEMMELCSDAKEAQLLLHLFLPTAAPGLVTRAVGRRRPGRHPVIGDESGPPVRLAWA
jgi:hypothetical protein